VAACGDDDDDGDETTAAATSAPAATSAAEEPASDMETATSEPAAEESAAETTAAEASGEPVNLTFWWWAESDAPGANAWLDQAVEAYKAVKPNVTIEVVEQATDTFIPTFQAAAAAKEGPDIASQWATGPVLTQVWGGAITPISDLVPAEEVAHWLNTSENTYDGKVWAMPLYLLGIPWVTNKTLMEQAGLTQPPATWDEVIAACEALRAKDIVPFAYGNDFYWTTQLMLQSLDSLDEHLAAVRGDASFTDPKYVEFEDSWKRMVDAGCFNDDVGSVSMPEAQERFAAGEVAMTVGADGNVRQWAKDLGGENLTVSKWPVAGSGALKDAYHATQSTSYFVTSWSEHQQEAADFLVFLHSPEQMAAWFEGTGMPPADDRFDAASITDPLDQQMYELSTTGPQIWLQNFFPPQVDINGNIPAQQLILGGQGDGAAAAQIRQRAAEQWRAQQPAELENWKAFQPPS
jgi:ABC-type glycerol-3-phosphate transport system substrate-binding protein